MIHTYRHSYLPMLFFFQLSVQLGDTYPPRIRMEEEPAEPEVVVPRSRGAGANSSSVRC